MAKKRTKQREHLNCGMTKEERLQKEATEREAQCREEELDLIDYCGIKNPTPYLAVKNIIRRERAERNARMKMTCQEQSVASIRA